MFKRIIYLLILIHLSNGLDYLNKNYFVIELNTDVSNQPLIEFINSHSDYTYEYQSPVDNHYVFSINKSHSHNDWLGNYNSNDYPLLKRNQQALELISNENLKSIHLLPPKQLYKRLPVPFFNDDDDEKRSDPLYQKRSDLKDSLFKRYDIVDSSQQRIKETAEKLNINDPMFIEQWHLINTNYPGNDVNVTGLWFEGITGKGITTAIIDDGVDALSADLQDNFNTKGSWDFNDNTLLPLPRLFDDYHGTRCAGEIAAVKNDVCGVGVAYDSSVSGIRILSGRITSEIEAAAMIYGLEENDIYSCSWGPTDDGKTLSAPDKIVKKAMIKGVQQGRKNKGSIYVFASGNGGRFEDSCNFDGYTNSIYSVTIGAIDHQGLHPSYSEACSAVMVVTYSSGSREHIHTTDIKNKCSAQHGGTSAAAPLAAGIFSLVLQANPDLTWRDLQYVAMLSSVPVNEDDGDYQINGLDRKYSHKYGYGKIDAYEMAHFGKNWKNVKPQAWYYSDVLDVKDTLNIKQGPPGTEDNSPRLSTHILNVTKEDLKIMNLERIEHVTVTVNILATVRGGVGVRLTSPKGIVSNLASFRPRDTSGRGFSNWTFMSVAHWGETGEGEWKLEVFGDETKPNTIVFDNWQLRFFGESIDADKAETYDLDKDYAQVRRDRLKEEKKQPEVNKPEETSNEPTSIDSSTTIDEGQETKQPEDPSTTTTSTTTDSSGSTSEPELEETDNNETEDGKNKQSTVDHTGQYFMGLAILGFIIVIFYMKYHKSPGSGRRKRRRDDYEFDIIPGEDYTDSETDDHDSMELARVRHDERADLAQQRLYDEFNPESLPDYQDEGEMFKIGDEEEEEHEQENDKKSDRYTKDKQPKYKDDTDTKDKEINDSADKHRSYAEDKTNNDGEDKVKSEDKQEEITDTKDTDRLIESKST